MTPSPVTENNVNNNNNSNNDNKGVVVNGNRSSGYNNNYKVDMVSQWVENQTYKDPTKTGEGCLFLTQFKQADSDSGSDGVVKVQVHDKKVAPPPPRVREEVEGSDSPEPLQDPNINSPCRVSRSEMGDISTVEVIEVEDRRRSNLELVDTEIQVTEDDILVSSTDPSHNHPLRILSEENLTVVSTFVADINDLQSDLGDDEDIDPSKFSFFSVPDFSNNNDSNDNYFETRLKELAKIGDDNLNANDVVASDKQCNNETDEVNK